LGVCESGEGLGLLKATSGADGRFSTRILPGVYGDMMLKSIDNPGIRQPLGRQEFFADATIEFVMD
jgi:hypothetical protein